MSISPYPTYKETGIKWLTPIPSHWEVKRLKYFCIVNTSNVDKKSKDKEPSIKLCNYTDVYNNDYITENLNFMEATASIDQIKKFTLHEGDTIITKDSETAEDIGISTYVPKDLPGIICGYHLSIIRPRPNIHGLFVKYLFDSNYIKALFSISANGLTRVGLSQYAINNIKLPLPPKEEQIAIATFLEQKIYIIDNLIIETENLIQLIKEKKEAVISNVITKGLNSSTQMKDSRVEWLGPIPKHWNLSPLKYIGRLQNGLNIGGEAFGSGFPFVTYGDVYKNQYLPQETSGLVKSSEKDQSKYNVEKGDIFFTRTSESIDDIGIASTALSSIPNATFAGFLIRFRPHKDILNEHYSSFLFRNQLIQKHFAGNMNIVTRASLSQSELGSISIPLPPVEEQEEISEFLTNKTKRINKFIKLAENLIDLLKEKKSGLISEAISGQLNVCNICKGELTQ